MVTIAELLRSGASVLSAASIPEPRREASSLLEFILKRDRTFVLAHPECTVDSRLVDAYANAVARRAGHEPFHYITGSREFYGLDLEVSPAVLIPRPETEMLVEHSIAYLSAHRRPAFCEVGVGSGCISIAILKNIPAAAAVGLEISTEAIKVAGRNAERHGVSKRLDLRRSDVFSALGGNERFGLIVSNPPYVPAAAVDGLQAEVRDHEPRAALTDGADGSTIIRRIIDEAPGHLEPGGALMLEIGMGQAETVAAMFRDRVWDAPRIEADLQGIPRTVSAKLKIVETPLNAVS